MSPFFFLMSNGKRDRINRWQSKRCLILIVLVKDEEAFLQLVGGHGEGTAYGFVFLSAFPREKGKDEAMIDDNSARND